jgi:hypothetical protein
MGGSGIIPSHAQRRLNQLICCFLPNNRIILDASARRFQAHKIYLRAAATKRWAMNREKVLQGRKPSSVSPADLKAIDDSLRDVCQPSLVETRRIIGKKRRPRQKKGEKNVENNKPHTVREILLTIATQ